MPSLTAVLVILTGILGAVMGSWLLMMRIRDQRAVGLAMGLNALATSILVPLLFRVIG